MLARWEQCNDPSLLRHHALVRPTTPSAAMDGSTGARARSFVGVPSRGATTLPLEACQRSSSKPASLASCTLGDVGIVGVQDSATQDFFAGATWWYFWSCLASRGVAHPSRGMRVGRSGGGRWEEIEGVPLVSLRSPLTAEACLFAPFGPISAKNGGKRAPLGGKVLARERTKYQLRYREIKSQVP